MPSYEKTLDADKDLEEIITYTYKKWGAIQTRKYMSEIEQTMEDMSLGKNFLKPFNIRKKIYFSRCNNHYIFGLKRNTKPMLILAILHEKMDLIQRLQKRF